MGNCPVGEESVGEVSGWETVLQLEGCIVGKSAKFLGIIPLTKELLAGHLSTEQGKLAEPSVMNVVNNKMSLIITEKV